MKRLIAFLSGMVLTVILFAILAYVPIPENGATAIAYQNLQNDYDATPLFYSEVDKYLDLEAGLTAELNKSKDKKSMKNK